MVHQHCSIDEVIGKVIRNTRVTDTAFIIDMDTWIGECMALLGIPQSFVQDYEDLTIKFHKSKLPCVLEYIDAVEYNGMRLPYGNSVKNIKTGPVVSYDTNPVYISKAQKIAVPNGNYVYSSTLEAANKLPLCSNEYYQVEMGYILTSFETGCVRVHFHKVPTDSNGLPFIPDNENCKESLYWYCRKKMIEAGYQDKVFNWDKCDAMYNLHAERAIGEIDYPSPDQVETKLNNSLHLLIPRSYWDNFFGVQNRQYE